MGMSIGTEGPYDDQGRPLDRDTTYVRRSHYVAGCMISLIFGVALGTVIELEAHSTVSPIAVCAASCHTQGDRMAEWAADRCVCVPMTAPKSVAIDWRQP